MSHKPEIRPKFAKNLFAYAKRQILPLHPKGPPALTDGPIVVAGMFKTANGMGEAARRFYGTLTAAGFDVVAVDTSVWLDQVDISSDIALTSMPDCHSGTLILIANAPETRPLLDKLLMRRWKAWRIIGYWAWELSDAPLEWLPIAEHCTEIWTLSDFTREAFKPLMHVRTVPIPIKASDHKPRERRGAPVACLIMADGRSSFERKNISAGLRIFTQAFGDRPDVRLTVKTRNGSEYHKFKKDLVRTIANSPNIELIDMSVTDKQRWDILSKHDIMLSTHRAEGFGLHLAEAMALGKAVIATGWSGNMQFMNEENSIPVPYTLEAVDDSFGVYSNMKNAKWARIDEAAAKEALIRLVESKPLRLTLGAAAKRDIENKLSGETLIDALLNRAT